MQNDAQKKIGGRAQLPFASMVRRLKDPHFKWITLTAAKRDNYRMVPVLSRGGPLHREQVLGSALFHQIPGFDAVLVGDVEIGTGSH